MYKIKRVNELLERNGCLFHHYTEEFIFLGIVIKRTDYLSDISEEVGSHRKTNKTVQGFYKKKEINNVKTD